MFKKIDELRNEHPKYRRISDKINSFSNKIFISCIAIIVLYIIIIFSMALSTLPDNIRVPIVSISGAFISLIVAPILINNLKHNQKVVDELFVQNEILYAELSNILVELLVKEYVAHGKNIKEIMAIDDKESILIPLKTYICENYDKMCNMFSIELIWDIEELYKECMNNTTTYINIENKVNQCFREIRKNSGAKGTFYINRSIIKTLSSN